ncbi:protein of unknown function [Kyrpidia spormannii]|uniref:Uncharacterized protein n=1 Tax=Kyrpidia spormannii TaxID=2055160 RepID=A0ACA8ZDY1_9BACL|nr:protein of unknown function [Kyrpidia spormannii]
MARPIACVLRTGRTWDGSWNRQTGQPVTRMNEDTARKFTLEKSVKIEELAAQQKDGVFPLGSRVGMWYHSRLTGCDGTTAIRGEEWKLCCAFLYQMCTCRRFTP